MAAPQTANKVIALAIGIVIITALFTGAVVFRPFWEKFQVPFNSTIYNINTTEGITAWGKMRGTINANFWLIPAVGALIVLAWIYMTMQEQEYIGGGYYR